MIEPTPGRIVWFYSARSMNWGDDIAGIVGPEHPRAAMVAHAYDDRTVNLMVTDRCGCPHAVHSVQLLQDDDRPAAPNSYWCAWMPFQKGQAMKLEQYNKKAAEEDALQAGVRERSLPDVPSAIGGSISEQPRNQRDDPPAGHSD